MMHHVNLFVEFNKRLLRHLLISHLTIGLPRLLHTGHVREANTLYMRTFLSCARPPTGEQENTILMSIIGSEMSGYNGCRVYW